jgi:hypothetical protein
VTWVLKPARQPAHTPRARRLAGAACACSPSSAVGVGASAPVPSSTVPSPRPRAAHRHPHAARWRGRRALPVTCSPSRPAALLAGPDFLDPMHHSAAAGGVPSINLDGWMMGQEHTRAAFRHFASQVRHAHGLVWGSSGDSVRPLLRCRACIWGGGAPGPALACLGGCRASPHSGPSGIAGLPVPPEARVPLRPLTLPPAPIACRRTFR